MAVSNDAKIWAVMGQSGTGKGLWVKAKLRKLKPKRIIILDPQDEYGEFASPFTKAEDFARMVAKAGEKGSFKVRFVFPKSCSQAQFQKIFELACQLAYLAGNCVFLVEELSNFTQASWAPPLWKRMCNSGRHEGVHIIGCSQFPAQIDKSFLSNATLLHVGYLGEAPHRKAVATRLDIPEQEIKALQNLAFLEWERQDRCIYKGTITTTGIIKQQKISA